VRVLLASFRLLGGTALGKEINNVENVKAEVSSGCRQQKNDTNIRSGELRTNVSIEQEMK